MTMKCTGTNSLTGLPVAVSFGAEIQAVESVASAAPGIFLAPGFIDLQVNGYAGVDYNLPTAPLEEIARSIRALYATGVTRFYPTMVTNSAEIMLACLGNIAEAKRRLPEGVAIEGIHVEGPHLSPVDGPRGAHPREWIRPPEVDLLHRMQEAAGGLIRLVTLSPEWPEAPHYIETAVREGMIVSIGHMSANADQIAAAVNSGATLSTHLGNGAHPLLPRHPNYIWDQLAEDRLTAGFIADGMHLPAAFLKAAFRAKGPARRFVVTDVVWPAGATPGRYQLMGKEVELTPDDRVVLVGKNAAEKTLAGSGLPMHKAVANLVRLAGLNLAEAVSMATVAPARAGKLEGRDKGLARGERGDIVEFRYNPQSRAIDILRTYISGALVYERQEFLSAA
jgi:N-acetylglucosamine-6-phosphate deacetylase